MYLQISRAGGSSQLYPNDIMKYHTEKFIMFDPWHFSGPGRCWCLVSANNIKLASTWLITHVHLHPTFTNWPRFTGNCQNTAGSHTLLTRLSSLGGPLKKAEEEAGNGIWTCPKIYWGNILETFPPSLLILDSNLAGTQNHFLVLA